MRLPLEPAEKAPVVLACRVCWCGPDDDGKLTCGHDEGVHRWPAIAGQLVVKHPAHPQSLVGSFRYPLTAERIEEYQERHRQAMLSLNLDPNVTVVALDDENRPVLKPGERLKVGETTPEAQARGVVVEVSALEWWIEPDPTVPDALLDKLAKEHPAPKPDPS